MQNASALLSGALSAGEIVGPLVGAAMVDAYSFYSASIAYAVIVGLCFVAMVVAKLFWRDFLVNRKGGATTESTRLLAAAQQRPQSSPA